MKSRQIYPLVWRSGLIWAACLFVAPFGAHMWFAINIATNYSLDPYIGGYLQGRLLGMPAGGLLAGFFTIHLIRSYGGLPAARALVPTLAWGVAMFLVGWLPLVVGNFFLQNFVQVVEG